MWLSPRDQRRSRGPCLQSILHALQIIVSREQNASQVHERDLHTPSTRCARPHPSALSIPKPQEGVEKSVSYSGPDVHRHHDYPFLMPFTGAASKKCGAFCTSHDRCKAIYRCAIHAEPCFAQVMPILQPAALLELLRRQRARSWPSQCAPETSCVRSPSSCQRTCVYKV